MEWWAIITGFFQNNLVNLVDFIGLTIAAATIIVKVTPTLRDDHVLKGIVKFIGKWIALDKYGPPKSTS